MKSLGLDPTFRQILSRLSSRKVRSHFEESARIAARRSLSVWTGCCTTQKVTPESNVPVMTPIDHISTAVEYPRSEGIALFLLCISLNKISDCPRNAVSYQKTYGAAYSRVPACEYIRRLLNDWIPGRSLSGGRCLA